MNESIFKAYDIRGIYPEEIKEEDVKNIARATVRFIKAKSILIAMDNRISSPSLKEAVLDGLFEEGVTVFDAGMTTTPMFYFAVNKSQADGGIMITASHNPPQYNGLKITSKEARPIGEISGLLEIKEMVLKGGFSSTVHDSALKRQDYLDAYVDFLTQGISVQPLTLAIDSACGVAGTVISKIASQLNLNIIPLCFAPCKELAHEGNPMKEENVQDLVAVLREGKADMGVAFDGDADRIFFFDNKGQRIWTHSIACVLADYYLQLHPKSSVIADVRMPKVLKEVVEKNNGTFLESRVGHTFIKKLMRERGSVFGAEVSGHYYYKDFFNADSGLYTLMQILNIMSLHKKTLKELCAPYEERFQSGELNYTVHDKQGAIDSLKNLFKDGQISNLDGLSIHFSDWWCNIRPSNTEPFLRVNIEANTDLLLQEKKQEIESIII